MLLPGFPLKDTAGPGHSAAGAGSPGPACTAVSPADGALAAMSQQRLDLNKQVTEDAFGAKWKHNKFLVKRHEKEMIT